MNDKELLDYSSGLKRELGNNIRKLESSLEALELLGDESTTIECKIVGLNDTVDVTEILSIKELITLLKREIGYAEIGARGRLAWLHNKTIVDTAGVEVAEPVEHDAPKRVTGDLTDKPVEKKKRTRVITTSVLPDEKLRQLYFDEGKKVAEISKEYNLKVGTLYKRLQDMQKQIKAEADKECASSTKE